MARPVVPGDSLPCGLPRGLPEPCAATGRPIASALVKTATAVHRSMDTTALALLLLIAATDVVLTIMSAFRCATGFIARRRLLLALRVVLGMARTAIL